MNSPMAEYDEKENFDISNETDDFDCKANKLLGQELNLDNLKSNFRKPRSCSFDSIPTPPSSYRIPQNARDSWNEPHPQDFMSQLLRLKGEIKKKFDNLSYIVEQRKINLLSQVEKIASDFLRQKDGVDAERSKILSVIEKADELGNGSTDLRDKITKSSKRRMSQLASTSAVNWDIKLEWTDYSEALLKLGELKLKQNPNYLMRNESYSVPIRHGKGEHDIGWATGIAISKNQIYVADSENNRVQIYSLDGDHVSQLRTSKMNWPFGICVRDEYIYVTQLVTHTVGMYNAKGECFATCGGKGNGTDKLNKPSGLDVFNSELFVCDQDNHRIQVFDSRKLSHKRKISVSSFNHPNDCQVSKCELFVLSLSDPCMHTFSLNGQLLRQFLSWGPGKEVTSSTFFTIDDFGNIIISELGGNCLKVFSYAGSFLSKITCDGALNQPRGICLDSNGQIFVSHRETKGDPSVVLMC